MEALMTTKLILASLCIYGPIIAAELQVKHWTPMGKRLLTAYIFAAFLSVPIRMFFL